MASAFPGPDPPFPNSPVLSRSLSFVSPSAPTLNSWSVTESKSVRVCHTWTIHNFSFVYSIGEEIRSDQFDVKDKEIGNSSWLLVCRMKLGTGERTESPRLCIRLNAKDADRELWVRGCLGVKQPDEVVPSNIVTNNNEGGATESVSLPPTPFGPRKFDVRCGIQISLPKLTDMQRDGLLLNDTLCVYGDLCLWSESFKNSSSVSRLSPDIVIPPCDLAADLKALWQDPEATHADIKLVTENKSFMAHKAMLSARSPMFRAMFSLDMKEKEASEIQVVDVTAETLAQMIEFMYTGDVADLDERADELLAAADKYGLSRLRCMCEQSLEKTFAVDTIAHTLVLSHLHSAKGLKDRAVDFIVAHVGQVRQSAGWTELEKSYPQLVADVFHALVTKQELPTLSLVKTEQNPTQQ